ncbi:MAG TPA: LytR C-terminal domain-containing protein, partial [Gemmatimonadaceae bacterium]
MKIGRLVIVSAFAALLLGGGGWYWWARAHHAPAAAVVPPPDLTAVGKDRVRVEVLNASTTRGLARRATFLLRDRGLDVVLIGTSAARTDSTVVLDRTNHPAWAQRVAAALGGV